MEAPPIVIYKFVESPPKPVVAEALCGINEGAVEDDAPALTLGVVLRAVFITNPVVPEPQVTVVGG